MVNVDDDISNRNAAITQDLTEYSMSCSGRVSVSRRGGKPLTITPHMIILCFWSSIDMNVRINEEMVNDRAKLILHRLIARRLSQDPDLIVEARSQLTVVDEAPDYVKEWDELLQLDPTHIRRVLTSRSERMRRLRLSSPFSNALDIQDPAFRKRVWRIARRGAPLPNRKEAVTEA
jgi:hypothetical protein